MTPNAHTEIKPTVNQKNELPAVMVHLPKEAKIYRHLSGNVKKLLGMRPAPRLGDCDRMIFDR